MSLPLMLRSHALVLAPDNGAQWSLLAERTSRGHGHGLLTCTFTCKMMG